ncbi:MAG: hypothetical protein NVS4B8_30280 [Herpetosiphon sp.]
MADPEAVARIRFYLDAHKATYDREALRRQLLADGHDPALVDQALTEVYSVDLARHSADLFGWSLGSFVVHGVLLPLVLFPVVQRSLIDRRHYSYNVLWLFPVLLLLEGMMLRHFGAHCSRLHTVGRGALWAAFFGVDGSRLHAVGRGALWAAFFSAMVPLIVFVLFVLVVGTCTLLSGRKLG